MRNSNRRQAPSPNGFNNHILFPILGIFFIVAGLALKFLALGLPWFALAINFIAKLTVALGTACLVPTIWRLFTNIQDELKNQDYDYNLIVLKSLKFEQQLYAMGLYEKDSFDTNKIRLPRVRLAKNGFDLSAIGSLRKQLLDDNTINEFNSFLALNKANRQIQSAYYRDGYIHYVVRRSIDKDRLHF